MNFEIQLTDNFKREARRLSKKYPSLKADLEAFFTDLSKNPTQGTPLGKQVFKVRLAIASKGKGKSGGVRIITYVKIDEKTVLVFSIYNKGEKETVSDKEILALLEKYAF